MRQVRALYSLIVRTQASAVKLTMLVVLGVVGGLISLALRGSGDALEAGTKFVDNFGLSLVVPVTALVFASAALGDFIDDSTMVYLWLRPVPRSRLVLAAAGASLSICVPLVVIPLAIAAAISGGGAGLVVATIVSSTVGLVAYTAVFTMLGVRVKRALLWGLLYIFVWEGIVGRLGATASKLAVGTYARSILASMAGFELELATLSTAVACVAAAAITAAALVYATRRLSVQDVA